MWAVEVAGGRTVADDVASRHGFTNKGPVSRSITLIALQDACTQALFVHTSSFSSQIGSIKDMYHFVLDSGNGVHMPDKTAALRAEPAVSLVALLTETDGYGSA